MAIATLEAIATRTTRLEERDAIVLGRPNPAKGCTSFGVRIQQVLEGSKLMEHSEEVSQVATRNRRC